MLTSFLLVALASPAPAQDGASEAAGAGTGWRLRFAPAEVLYPAPVADPRRPTFSLTMVHASESEIPAAGDRRYGLRMGARFGILQIHPARDPHGGFQVAGDVGFLAQFDRENSTDNLGWDGVYGFHLAWLARSELVLRVGIAHDSSHLGDEYIESTGRTRIEYTREEYVAGLRYAPLESLSGLVEYGWAYDLRNEDLMEEGRAQLGVEFEPPATWWNGRLAPFAALDISAYQEDDWHRNLSVQLGIVRPGAGRGVPWRLGLEYYDGRSAIGEFFQERERHLAWGLWVDL